MGSLTGKEHKLTYKQLLNIGSENSGVSASLVNVTDGAGVEIPVEVSTTTVNMDGIFQITGTTFDHSSAAQYDVISYNGTKFTNTDLGTLINAQTGVTPASADMFLIADASDSNNLKKVTYSNLTSGIDHDALTNYVANEHVDHTSVTMTAGSGLSGGGDISATRTFSLDINGQSTLTLATGDELIVGDVDDSNNLKKTTVSGILGLADHDTLTNFVANEHIDHSTVTITAGEGLTGGGTIAADRTIDVDVNGLSADASPDSAADYVLSYDASAGSHKKVLMDDLPSAGGAPTSAQYVTLATDGTLSAERVLTAGEGITLTDAGAGSTVTVDGVVTSKNHLINGNMDVWQRGTSFTAATSPANNDDTYLVDRWILLSDGNDIVDVSQETSIIPDGSKYSLKFDVQTINKKFGIVQILESFDSRVLAGQSVSLSFQARTTSGQLENLRAGVISWSSTADSITSDVVSVWNTEGSNPTLATNWTFENTPSNLALTNSFQTFSIDNISVDTASTTNVGVFIWLDDTDGAVNDVLYITQVKLEIGEKSTYYNQEQIIDQISRCQRYYYKTYNLETDPGTVTNVGEFRIQANGTGGEQGGHTVYPTTMRATPTVTFYSPNSGTSGKRYNYTGTADENQTGYVTSGERGGSGLSGSFTSSSIYGYHVTAEAEL